MIHLNNAGRISDKITKRDIVEGSFERGAVRDSRESRMESMLRELRAEIPGVEAAVLISSDAMPLASDANGAIQEEAIAAMASVLISSGERAAGDLLRGNVEQLYLRGDEGDLVVVKVNDDAVLACTVDHQAKMGITLLEVNRCAQKLSQII